MHSVALYYSRPGSEVSLFYLTDLVFALNEREPIEHTRNPS